MTSSYLRPRISSTRRSWTGKWCICAEKRERMKLKWVLQRFEEKYCRAYYFIFRCAGQLIWQGWRWHGHCCGSRVLPNMKVGFFRNSCFFSLIRKLFDQNSYKNWIYNQNSQFRLVFIQNYSQNSYFGSKFLQKIGFPIKKFRSCAIVQNYNRNFCKIQNFQLNFPPDFSSSIKIPKKIQHSGQNLELQ